MTHCNTLSVKFSYSQLNKLKPGTKHVTKVNPFTQSAISFFFEKLKYEIRNKVFDFRFYTEVETENIKISGFPIFKITEH